MVHTQENSWMTENDFPSSLREETMKNPNWCVRIGNPSLCVRIGKNGVMGSGFHAHVRMKSLLVDWACGKG